MALWFVDTITGHDTNDGKDQVGLNLTDASFHFVDDGLSGSDHYLNGSGNIFNASYNLKIIYLSTINGWYTMYWDGLVSSLVGLDYYDGTTPTADATVDSATGPFLTLDAVDDVWSDGDIVFLDGNIITYLPISTFKVANYSPIFSDTFFYRGHQGLPGSKDLPDHFSIISGSWTTAGETTLKASEPGELLYSGDDLHDIKRETGSDANFALTVGVFTTEDLKFSIRGRRVDADNFVSVNVDFESQTISLSETIGASTTTLASADHSWIEEGLIQYNIGLWMNGNVLKAYVGRQCFLEARSLSDTTVSGFSLSVPEMWEDTPVNFGMVVVNETDVYPNQQPVPVDNLWLDWRLEVKQRIEQPAVRTWETFIQARILWQRAINDGMTNESWQNYGYPVEEPTPESWFAGTPCSEV